MEVLLSLPTKSTEAWKLIFQQKKKKKKNYAPPLNQQMSTEKARNIGQETCYGLVQFWGVRLPGVGHFHVIHSRLTLRQGKINLSPYMH